MNEYLNGETTTILGAQVSSLEYFRNLQALYAFILYSAELSDFDDLSPSEALAFGRFSDNRDDLNPRPASVFLNQGRRKHLLNPRYDSPELIAAVTRLAVQILAAEDDTSMAILLRRLTDRFFVLRSNRWQFVERFNFGESIATVISKNMEPMSTFTHAVGRKSAVTRDTLVAFGPQHVPALLWKGTFDDIFSKLFTSIPENVARHYCAMALIKVCSDYTWAHSAVKIGLTAHYGKYIARRCANHLRKTCGREEFAKALRMLARDLSSDPHKIDYSARREILSDAVEIPPEHWSEICKIAGVRVGHCGVRSKYAAAWLWAVLTGGDWHWAPALAEKQRSENASGSYRRYGKTIFPKIAPHLLAYGYRMIEKAE